MYRGIWTGLVAWFKVPDQPPTLPVHVSERVEAFRPAPGFLQYLKFWFWLGFWPMDLVIAGAMVGVFLVSPVLGFVLLLPAVALAVLPDVVTYIALHLRYDSTWYLLSDRALRIRRGIWVITEITVTFENVQNLRVQAGPVQRWFGIADVVIETAGGGAGPDGSSGHVAVIQGVADAAAVRQRIMREVERSGTAGLGDEDERGTAAGPAWRSDQLAVLRQIADEAHRLAPR
jgi:membrane protein YdbS with pleckstrin-like domain